MLARHRLAPPGWALPGAFLDMDFANHRYFGASLEQCTFTRASQGFAEYSLVGNNRILGTFASGVPRITDNGLLVELAATNLALRSRDFANAAWVATNVTVAQTSVGADGTTNGAARLTAGAVNSTLLQVITASSSQRVLSFYIKRVTGSGTVGICQDGVTFTDISAQLSTGAFVQVSLIATQLNPTIGIQLGTSGDAIDVDFAQLETGAVLTSPIVTTSASASRSADILTKPISSGLYGSAFAAIGACFDASAARRILSIDDGSANNLIALVRSTSQKGQLLSTIASVSTTATSGNNLTTGAEGKVMGSWAPTSIHLAVAGSTVATAAPADEPVTQNIMRVGSQVSGTGAFQGFIKRVALWRTAVPDQLLQALTT